MPQVVTFGETMVAFTPTAKGPLRYVHGFEKRIAGAESNFAIGLARLGHTSGWVSRLGNDEFGHYIQNFVRGEGVDTTWVTFDDTRPTGVMFKQVNAGETTVLYYRDGSAASQFAPVHLNEEYIAQSSILHMTGITPTLGESCAEACAHAVKLAKKHGVKVSFDPNIRLKLWREEAHKPLLLQLLFAADIVLAGKGELALLLGEKDSAAMAQTLFEKGKAECVAIKNGASGAHVADRASGLIKLTPHPCNTVEPVGAGDAFDAGFLAGLLEGKDIQTCGVMAAVCGALATETTGDIEGLPDAARLQAVMAGKTEIHR